MEQSKIVRSDINALSSIMWSVASKRFLDFIDFTSVIACIWTVFCLIYFNFVKDFIEILVYATFKYVNRIRWLYRLLQLDNILKRFDDLLETCNLDCSRKANNFSHKEISENSPRTNVSINNTVVGEYSRNVLQRTPCSFKNKLDINPRHIDFADEPRSAGASPRDDLNNEKTTISAAEKYILLRPEINLVSSHEKDAVSSPAESAICNTEEYLDSNKNVISSSEPNNVVRSLVNYEPDAVFASPEQGSDLAGKFFSWNFNKIRDSFRKESKNKTIPALPVKVKCKNLAEKVIQVQPTGVEDNERLITNASPVNFGCCNSLFTTLRSKLQTKENIPCSMHYKRF